MGVFFGAKPGDIYDLGRNARVYSDRLPSDVIPVASDPGGNELCIAVAGSHVGRVFFYDRVVETIPGVTKEDPWDGLWPVSDSWDDFISSLRGK